MFQSYLSKKLDKTIYKSNVILMTLETQLFQMKKSEKYHKNVFRFHRIICH